MIYNGTLGLVPQVMDMFNMSERKSLHGMKNREKIRGTILQRVQIHVIKFPMDIYQVLMILSGGNNFKTKTEMS